MKGTDARGGPIGLGTQMENGVDLDRGAAGQRGHGDREPGVFAGLVAEHLDHQVGRAVDDRGRAGEVGPGIDEAAELDRPGAVDVVAERGAQLGQDVQPAQAGGGIAVLDRQIAADLAGRAGLRGDRHLSGDEDLVAAAPAGHVVRRRDGRLRQRDSKFAKTRIDTSGHS